MQCTLCTTVWQAPENLVSPSTPSLLQKKTKEITAPTTNDFYNATFTAISVELFFCISNLYICIQYLPIFVDLSSNLEVQIFSN